MQWTLVALLLLSATARAGDGFDLILSQGMAPCAIHVSAKIDPKDALNTRLLWDFGDPQGAHNSLAGFNAAHLYTRAGEYTITLKEISDSGDKTFTKKIFIAADRRRMVFISAQGSDSHTGLAEGNAVKTFARAMSLVGDGTMLFLHRGDVFDVEKTLTIDKRNVVIGAYGTGAAPILRGASTVNDLISTTATANDVVIRDIAFESTTPGNWNKDGAPRAIRVGGTNIAMDHLTFLNVCDATNCEALPRGVLLQDCVVPDITSLRGYLMWGAGKQLVVLGCSAGNSTREHIVRLGGADHVLINGNDFNNISRTDAGDPSDIGKGTLVLQKCSFVYAAENTLRNGLGVGPLEGVDGSKDPHGEARNVVVEHNNLINGNINIHPGAHDVAIRDNTIRLDLFPTIIVTATDDTKLPDGRPVYPDRNISNIQILRNTATNESRDGIFLMLHPGAPAGTVTLKGNTYIARNWTTGDNQDAAVFVMGNDLTSFAEISNNIWPAPRGRNPTLVFYVFPKWYDPAGYLTADQWAKFPQVNGDKVE